MAENNAPQPYEDAISEALENEPRAAELKRMAILLVERRTGLLADFETAGQSERPKLKRDISKLSEQISVLREEANITEFIEDAVRVGIEMRKMEN